MLSKEEIEKKIDEILSDERISYKTATIFENAPLALIQLEATTKLHAYQDVLQIQRTDIKKLRKEK